MKRGHRSDNTPSHVVSLGTRDRTIKTLLPDILHSLGSKPVIADASAGMRKACIAKGCTTPHLKGSKHCREHEVFD